MEIIKFDKFFEANLSHDDLLKSDKEFNNRGERFVNKLRNYLPFTVGNNVVVISHMFNYDDGNYYKIDGSDGVDPLNQILNDRGEFDPIKSKKYFSRKKVFKSENNFYKLTDILKSNEFGSAGPGKNIYENEIIQMVILSKLISAANNGRYTNDYIFTDGDLSKILKDISNNGFIPSNCKYKSGIDLQKFERNNTWDSTFLNAINKIYNKKYNGYVIRRGVKYEFYHNSYSGESPFKKIQSQFEKFKPKEFINGEKTKEININMNKYCPADIWLLSETHKQEVYKVIDESSNLENLTKNLNDLFVQKKLIPISLKKIGGSESSLVIINNERNVEPPKFDVETFLKEIDLDRGIGTMIITNSKWKQKKTDELILKKTMKIDTSDSSKYVDVDGEVGGDFSRHGKVSFAAMCHFIGKSKYYDGIGATFSSVKDLSNKNVEELKDMLTEIDNKVNSLLKNSRFKSDKHLMGRKNNFNEKKIISKIQSLQILRALLLIDEKDPSKEEVDKIVTDIFYYALSIDIGDLKTPLYVRVIDSPKNY